MLGMIKTISTNLDALNARTATIGSNVATGVAVASGPMGVLEKKVKSTSGAFDHFTKGLAVNSQRLRTFGYLSTAFVTMPIVGIGKAIVDTSAQFEFSIQKIVGLAGIAQDSVNQWREAVLKMAPDVGRSPHELAEGLYYVASSGIKSSAALDVVRVSAMAATAGLGETKDIADVLTSALNAYAGTGLTAARAMDVLIAAVREGKGEASDFSSALGQIIPIASLLGVSFDQLAGGMAAITLTGSSAANAAVYLKGVMNSLLKATPGGEQALGRLGTSYAELRKILGSGPTGLIDLMQKLRDIQEQYGEETVSDILPNIRGLTAYLSIAGKNFKYNTELMKRVTDSSGSLAVAFAAVSETLKVRLDMALVRVRKSLIDLGETIGPTIIKMIDRWVERLDKFADRWNGLTEAQRKFRLEMVAFIAIAGPFTLALSTIGYTLLGIINTLKWVINLFVKMGTARAVLGGLFKTASVGHAAMATSAAASTTALTANTTALYANAGAMQFVSTATGAMATGTGAMMIKTIPKILAFAKSFSIIGLAVTAFMLISAPLRRRIREMKAEMADMKDAMDFKDPIEELREQFYKNKWEPTDRWVMSGDVPMFNVPRRTWDTMGLEELRTQESLAGQVVKLEEEKIKKLKTLNDARLKNEEFVQESLDKIKKWEERRNKLMTTTPEYGKEPLSGLQGFNKVRITLLDKKIAKERKNLGYEIQKNIIKNKEEIAVHTRLANAMRDQQTSLQGMITQNIARTAAQERALELAEEIRKAYQNLADNLKKAAAMEKLLGDQFDYTGEVAKIYQRGLEAILETTENLNSPRFKKFFEEFQKAQISMGSLTHEAQNLKRELTAILDMNQMKEFSFGVDFDLYSANVQAYESAINDLLEQIQKAREKNPLFAFDIKNNPAMIVAISLLQQLQAGYKAAKEAMQNFEDQKVLNFVNAQASAFGGMENQLEVLNAQLQIAERRLRTIGEEEGFSDNFKRQAERVNTLRKEVKALKDQIDLTFEFDKFKAFQDTTSYIGLLNVQIDILMERMKELSMMGQGDTELFKDYARAVESLELTQGAVDSLTNALADLFSVTQDDFKSFGDFLSSWVRSITRSLQQVLAEFLAKKIMGALLASFGGMMNNTKVIAVGSNIINESGGPIVKGLAKGGMIPPGYPNDSFPAMLTSGEVVIPKEKVQDPVYVAEMLGVPGFQKGYGEPPKLDPYLNNEFWKKFYGEQSYNEYITQYQKILNEKGRWGKEIDARERDLAWFGARALVDQKNRPTGERIGRTAKDLLWGVAPDILLGSGMITKAFGKLINKLPKRVLDKIDYQPYLDENLLPRLLTSKVRTNAPEMPVEERLRVMSEFIEAARPNIQNVPMSRSMFTNEYAERLQLGDLIDITPGSGRTLGDYYEKYALNEWRPQGNLPSVGPPNATFPYMTEWQFNAYFGQEIMNDRALRQMMSMPDLEQGPDLVRKMRGMYLQGGFNPFEHYEPHWNSFMGYEQFYNRYSDIIKRKIGFHINEVPDNMSPRQFTEDMYRRYLSDTWVPSWSRMDVGNSRLPQGVLNSAMDDQQRYHWADPYAFFDEVFGGANIEAALDLQPNLLDQLDILHTNMLRGRWVPGMYNPMQHPDQYRTMEDFLIDRQFNRTRTAEDIWRSFYRNQTGRPDTDFGIAGDPYHIDRGRLSTQRTEDDIIANMHMGPGRILPRQPNRRDVLKEWGIEMVESPGLTLGKENMSNMTRLESIRALEVLGLSDTSLAQAIAQTPDEQFERMVMDVFGKLQEYDQSGFRRVKHKFLPGAQLIQGADALSSKAFVDLFNRYIDGLNFMLAEGNKSGIPFRVTGLEIPFADQPNYGLLNLWSQKRGVTQWTTELLPGQFGGDVKKLHSAEYYRSIPGMFMTNTGSPIHGDKNIRGTHIYEGMSEYLKTIGARLHPGFNTQTASSFTAWKKIIERDKGIGYLSKVFSRISISDPPSIHGVAKSLLPAFGVSPWLLEDKVPELQHGGVVPPGFPNDSYPAMLSSGEMVIPLDKIFKIFDKRVVDAITGQPVSDRSRLHGTLDLSFVEEVVRKALERSIDPYTALAIPHVETGGTPSGSSNPYAINYESQEQVAKLIEDTIGASLDILQGKLKLADKLEYDTYAKMVQMYNGMGKLTRGAVGGNRAYGIEIPEEGIRMKENPLYGKRVEDVRNNILMQNEELVAFVERLKQEYNAPKYPSVLFKATPPEYASPIAMDTTKMVDELLSKINLMGGMLDMTLVDLNKVNTTTKTINEATQGAQTAVTTSGSTQTTETTTEATEAAKKAADASQKVDASLQSTIGANLGAVIATGIKGGDMQAATKAAMGSIAATGASMYLTPALITALGPIGAVMGPMLGSLLGGLFGGRRMAEGGIVPPGYNNDTFHAMLSSNEAVIPLTKLNDMIVNQNSDEAGVVEFRIAGDELVGIHDKRRKTKSKF